MRGMPLSSLTSYNMFYQDITQKSVPQSVP
jgi:hypothetical protein